MDRESELGTETKDRLNVTALPAPGVPGSIDSDVWSIAPHESMSALLSASWEAARPEPVSTALSAPDAATRVTPTVVRYWIVA